MLSIFNILYLYPITNINIKFKNKNKNINYYILTHININETISKLKANNEQRIYRTKESK